MTAVVQAVKPQLKFPFGVNYLWDPLASVAIARRDRARASCARSSPASSPPTWGFGSPIAPAPCACAAVSAATT